MSELWRTIKHSLPNSSGDVYALTSRQTVNERGNPHFPVWLFQIIGGRTWSISFVKLGPVVKARPRPPVSEGNTNGGAS